MFSTAYIQDIMKEVCGVSSTSKLLLTVSGGMDSMVMLDVMHKAGYRSEVAHCNFNLRGDESDGDALLVKQECDKMGIVYYEKSFDTKGYAAQNGISIEMAARDLRYEWFYSLIEEQTLDVIVTAHHGDDAIETFFLNLIRGTGIKGLTGMKAVNNRVVRPFLNFSRVDIEKYCKENSLAYRHDSSNYEVKYLRNKVRHEIIPLLTEMNPSFFSTMEGNLKRLAEVEELLEKEVGQVRDDFVVEEQGRLLIPITKIAEHPQKSSVLFELLRPYGFNSNVIGDILKSISGIPGKQFYSHTHRLIRDRFNLILFEHKDISDDEFYINSGVASIDEPIHLRIKTFLKPDNYSFSKDSVIAHFDADQIEFPLVLRRWRQGDSFRPLGMKGFKKLSDFFINQKLSIADKEGVWLLQTGEDIIWIVGMRLDDRFKITNRTNRILELKVEYV